jgi:hypothetical protein
MGKKIEFEPRRGHIGKKVEGSPEQRPFNLKQRKAVIRIKLHKIPKKLRGKEAAELIVGLKLLEFGITSYKRARSVTDLVAFKPFTKNPQLIRVQVKSCSLSLHDIAFHVDETSLESFRGWYIVYVEQVPSDVFYYIPDSIVRRHIEENKDNRKKVYHDPQRKRWYVRILGNEADFEEYLKPDGFVEVVLGIPMEQLPEWLEDLNT